MSAAQRAASSTQHMHSACRSNIPSRCCQQHDWTARVPALPPLPSVSAARAVATTRACRASISPRSPAMQEDAAVAAVQLALQRLQEALDSSSGGGKGGSGGSSLCSQQQQQQEQLLASCSRALGQLSSCIHALLQQHHGMVQALETRTIAERALRNVIASRDAEAARLQGEVGRLRAAAASAADPASSISQQGKVQDTASARDPVARQAVLQASVPAKDKPTAIVHHLQSEVAAQAARIASLEAQLAAEAADSSSRQSGQQQAFLAKLEQLRTVHAQQLAGAAEEARAHQARCAELERQLADAVARNVKEQQCEAAAAAVLPGRRDSAPASPPQQPAAVPPAAASEAAAAEVAALQQMEAQLSRLSGTVRALQAERQQLQAALITGAAERLELQAQLRGLQQQAAARGDPHQA